MDKVWNLGSVVVGSHGWTIAAGFRGGEVCHLSPSGDMRLESLFCNVDHLQDTPKDYSNYEFRILEYLSPKVL